MNKELQNSYPLVFKTVEHLKASAGFFEKTLSKLLESNYNFEFAERVCKTALEMSSNNWDAYLKKVDKLTEMSLVFLRLQIKLEKTGKYLYSTFKEVEDHEYKLNEGEYGPDYLWGMYFSEVFWKIHHNFTNFFLEDFVKNNKTEGKVLEIPSGTGFFLGEFLLANPSWSGTGIDLSDASISFSKKLFNVNKIPEKSYIIIKKDFLEYPDTEKFDKIMCGEFLEHVEDPVGILTKLNQLLKDDGKVFLTAAVWAAHIDHIYLYNNAEEVRNHIRKAGFLIEKELVQASFEKDEADPEKSKIPVSYAAILSKN